MTRTSSLGVVYLDDKQLRLESSLTSLDGDVTLQLRVTDPANPSFDLWAKINDVDFRDLVGVSCSLDRFAAEIFDVLNGSGSQSRRLEVTEESGNFGLALIHVDGVWQTEELVLPLHRTPVGVQLAEAWNEIRRAGDELRDVSESVENKKACLQRVCPQNSSLVALKESVEFWRHKTGSLPESFDEHLSFSGDTELEDIQAQLADLKIRREESERKVKALEELKDNLSSACVPLLKEKKVLESLPRIHTFTHEKQETGLTDLRATKERMRKEVDKMLEDVRKKKRLVHFGFAPDFRNKQRNLTQKAREIAGLEAEIKKRERVTGNLASELMTSELEARNWDQRRKGLLWLETWLRAKDEALSRDLYDQARKLQKCLDEIPRDKEDECGDLVPKLRDRLEESKENRVACV